MFRNFVWIHGGQGPSFTPAGNISHLQFPISVRSPNSKFTGRTLEDVKTDVGVVCALFQGAFGIDPADGTGPFIFDPIVKILNGNPAMWRVSPVVIESDISLALAALTMGLFKPEASKLTRTELLNYSRDLVSANFQPDRIVVENTFLYSNPSFYKDNFPVFPLAAKGVGPAFKRASSPEKLVSPGRNVKQDLGGNGKGGTPGGGKVRGGGNDDRPPLPCHNYIASELGIPGSAPCRGQEDGSCKYDHTPLPLAGTMTQAEKETFCVLIMKAKTGFRDEIIEAIADH